MITSSSGTSTGYNTTGAVARPPHKEGMMSWRIVVCARCGVEKLYLFGTQSIVDHGWHWETKLDGKAVPVCPHCAKEVNSHEEAHRRDRHH